MRQNDTFWHDTEHSLDIYNFQWLNFVCAKEFHMFLLINLIFFKANVGII
jgi:hypothetical protein